MYLVMSPAWNNEPKARATSSPFQTRVTFLRALILGHFFERRSSDKIMIELDERPVTKIVGSQIIVGNFIGIKTAAQ